MGTLASGSIDLKSLKVAGEPNKYVTMIDGSGIRVHEAGAVNTNFSQINSNGMQIYKGGSTNAYKIADFGSDIRIGAISSQHALINSSGLTIYKGSETAANKVATFGSSISLASNEATVTIGSTSKYHTVLSNTGIDFKNGANSTNKTLMSISGNKVTLYEANTTTAAAILDSGGLHLNSGSISLSSTADAIFNINAISSSNNNIYGSISLNNLQTVDDIVYRLIQITQGWSATHQRQLSFDAAGIAIGVMDLSNSNIWQTNCNIRLIDDSSFGTLYSINCIGNGINIRSPLDSSKKQGTEAFTINDNGNGYNALTVDWNGNVNIASGAKYKINGVALSASDVSAIALSDKYTRSSVGGLDWSNNTEGDSKVIMKSALAFWNGSYDGSTSNLTRFKASNGTSYSFGTLASKNSLSAADVGAVPKSICCFANSVVRTPSSGTITFTLSELGITNGAKPVGILITYQDGGATPTILRYDYDASSSSSVVIKAYDVNGNAVSSAIRFFMMVFQGSWTSV